MLEDAGVATIDARVVELRKKNVNSDSNNIADSNIPSSLSDTDELLNFRRGVDSFCAHSERLHILLLLTACS